MSGRPSNSTSWRKSTNEVELPSCSARRAATMRPRTGAKTGLPRSPRRCTPECHSRAGASGKNPVARSSLAKKAALRAASSSSRVRGTSENARSWRGKYDPRRARTSRFQSSAPGSHFCFCKSTCRCPTMPWNSSGWARVCRNGWPSRSGITGFILGKMRSKVRLRLANDSYCSGRKS